MKGAPEEVLKLCSATIDYDLNPSNLNIDEILDVVATEIAPQGLKPLSYAFKEMDRDQFQ